MPLIRENRPFYHEKEIFSKKSLNLLKPVKKRKKHFDLLKYRIANLNSKSLK
jgi:hypothetical protein